MGGKSSKETVTAECDELMAPMEQRDGLESQAHSFSTSTKNTLNIAIAGKSGAGKSSLVNALRGMKRDDELGAAPTDVVQCTMEATAYVHPTHPEITFWDLPGSETPEFKGKRYIKDMKLNQYDFFIIISKERFTEADAQLASAIHKMNKKFFYVRTKVDVDLENERERPNFSEEETLEKIKKECCEYLKEVKRESSPKLFLISRWDLEKYDFPALEQALWDECDNLKRHTSELPLGGRARSTERLGGGYLLGAISRRILSFGLEKMKSALQEKDISAISAEGREVLDLLEKTTLNIAVTGRAGAGKSSFVNALRGMTDHEEDSAETGVTQTTMEAKGYKHPLFPKVMLWDLPGIGTPEFKAAEYLKKVDFEKYDFFIIIASGRFTEHETKLAQEIQKMNKRFYYVRTKVDVDMNSESRKPNFSKEQTLEKLQKNCCDNLKKAGESSPKTFLVTRKDLGIYDFPLLYDTLEKDLDEHKRLALLMAMPTFSNEMLKKKRAAMENLIWTLAAASCVGGLIPVPGLSLVCDIPILVGALIYFCKVFCLDDDSLRRLSEKVGKPIDDLRSAIKNTPMLKNITPELVTNNLLKSAACFAVTALEVGLDFVPVVGSIFGGISSFAMTYLILHSFLKNAEVDAANVRAVAAQP